MYAGGAKRRGERLVQFLRQGARRGFFVVGNTIKSVPHPDIEFSGPCDFQRQVMESAFARALVERRLVGTISDQVETFLILQDAANPSTEIIIVFYGNPTRLVREIIETLLVIEGLVSPLIVSLLQLSKAELVAPRQIVRGLGCPADRYHSANSFSIRATTSS